jgi:hypothetical protein
MMSIDKHFWMPRTVNRIDTKQAPEEQYFGNQKNPHSKLGSLALLIYITVVVVQI